MELGCSGRSVNVRKRWPDRTLMLNGSFLTAAFSGVLHPHGEDRM